MYVHQTRNGQKYEACIELKGEIDKYTFITGDINILLLKLVEHKISKSIKYLKNTIKQQYLIKPYRAVHTTSVEHKFYSCPQNICQKQTKSLAIKQISKKILKN